MTLEGVRDQITNRLALKAISNPLFEHALVVGCRNPASRRTLRLGAVALAYARVLDRQELRVQQLDGYRMYVNVAEHCGIVSYFFRESVTAWLTPRLVGPGGRCADVGANAGIYTFLFGSLVGPSGRVVAFEPNPSCASLIERSIALNGWEDRVSLVPRAVSDVAGQRVRFFLSTNPNNTGTSSLLNHGVYVDDESAIEALTTSLDSYSREHGIERWSVVKVDVERAEDRVMRGAAGLLAAHRIDYLITEMLAGTDAQRILEGYGYRWFLIDQQSSLVPIERVAPGHFADFLAVSPSASAHFQEHLGASVR
jgi:FkbM family methyltransferase